LKKRKEYIEQFEKILCTISIFWSIFLPSLNLNFFWFWNIPNHILKKYTQCMLN